MIDKNLHPRVLRTRKRLRDTLMSLLSEQDFSTLTVQDVTKHAGIHRSTFYLHYTGLPELLEDCTRTLFNQMRAEINSMINLRQGYFHLEPFVESVFHHLDQYQNFYRVMLGKRGNPLFDELFQAMLSEFIFERFIGRDAIHNLTPSLGLIVVFFTSGFQSVAEWWLTNDKPLSSEQAARQIARDILPIFRQMMKAINHLT